MIYRLLRFGLHPSPVLGELLPLVPLPLTLNVVGSVLVKPIHFCVFLFVFLTIFNSLSCFV